MDEIKDYTVNEDVKLQLQKVSFCVGQALCSALVGTAPLPLHGKGCQGLDGPRGASGEMEHKITLPWVKI